MHKAEKKTNQITRATLSIIDNLVKDMTASEILAKLEEGGTKSRAFKKNFWFGIQSHDV